MGIRDPLSKAILFILQNLFDLQLIFLSCFSKHKTSWGFNRGHWPAKNIWGYVLGESETTNTTIRANLNQPSLGSAIIGSVKSP
jgi:hypothetical protein